MSSASPRMALSDSTARSDQPATAVASVPTLVTVNEKLMGWPLCGLPPGRDDRHLQVGEGDGAGRDHLDVEHVLVEEAAGVVAGADDGVVGAGLRNPDLGDAVEGAA